MHRLIGLARLVHPAPAIAVVALSAALAAILARDSPAVNVPTRVGLLVASVAGSQILTGALNDWADRDRDAAAGRNKPIPVGLVSPPEALIVAASGVVVLVAAAAPLGALTLSLALAAGASAVAYDLWLSRTPFSLVPYLVSFGILPAWIAAGVGVPLQRVAGAVLMVGPFAAAAHLANTLRDYDADRASGSRSLVQLLGRRRSHALALGLAIIAAVGGAVMIARSGDVDPASAALGVLGLAAIAAGVSGPRALWIGILVAAVCWTVAWGLATG